MPDQTSFMHYLGHGVGKVRLNTWDELTAAADGGLLEETQWVELKEMLSPGKPGNRELAKDLAALSVHGGVLIIGVRDKTFELVGIDVDQVGSYTSRISQVASMSIHPPLSPVTSPPIVNPEDESKAVLVVEVPASAVAPHMANERYWGRSSDGVRALSDPEVRALISARDNSDSTFLARLKAMPANDPVNDRVIDAPTGNGHIFLLAEPCAPVVGRDSDFDLAPVVCNEVGDQSRNAVGALRDRTRDPRGLGMAYPSAAEPVVERWHEDHIGHLLVFDDSSVEFVSGGGTYFRRGSRFGGDSMELVGTGVVVIAVREFLQLIEVLSLKHWGYTGQWRVGLHITSLKGKPVTFNDIWRSGMTFPTDVVTAALTTSPATWEDGVDPVARKLLAGFLRAIGCDKWELDNIIGR